MKHFTIQFVTVILFYIASCHAATDTKSHLVKETTVIMIENDGNTPIDHHLIDCDERSGHSKLSHIVAKLANTSMPVNKTDDGKWWRIDLSSKPIEPGIKIPIQVTKVYTHLELVPNHDVYLIPYSSIQYQVRIIKQGRPQKIKVPSERYYLVVDNRELVDLDESTSTAYAIDTEGSTKLRFVDRSVITDEDFIQPESNIHIVQPSYLTMHISPGDDSWDLQKFTDYTIEIRIYDYQGNRIYPSDNLSLQLASGNELVITNSTQNGTYHNVHTLNTGPSKLIARLLGTTNSQTLDVELSQDIYIHQALEIRPTLVILPWLPDVEPTYQVSVFAAGGTGSYIWFSTLGDISYGTDDTSVAKITTSSEGEAVVSCTDAKSSVFAKQAHIIIARPVDLAILPSVTETEVGGDIILPIAVYANKTDKVLFHDCSKIKFNVDITDRTRFTSEVSTDIKPKSCASIKFTCTQPGSSKIWISYADLKAPAIIACYRPLHPIYPTEVGVLAVHTSIQIAFEGGPRPFGDHFAILEPKNNPIIKIEPSRSHTEDLHVFKAHCNQYGDVQLTLIVGNNASNTLPNPATSKSSVRIVCAKPHSMLLKPRLKESCPLNEVANLADTLVPITNAAPTDFELQIFDDAKRQFLNISSFKIDWNLRGHGVISSSFMVEETNTLLGFRKSTRNSINVRPNGRKGFGRLQAILPEHNLESRLDIQYVETAHIAPGKAILYNHHKNVVVLTIVKGSGYFSVDSLQGAKHANVSYESVLGHHRIRVTPLRVGKFALRLEDLCSESNTILSEVIIVNQNEFSREILEPGRKLNFCSDIDDSMFCVYLSLESMQILSTTQTPAPQAQSMTAAPIFKQPQTTPRQPSTPQPQPTIEAQSTTPPPRISFADSLASPKDEDSTTKTGIMHRIFAYLLVMVTSAAAVTLGYKWWQDQNRKRPHSTISSTATESSFLRQSLNSSVRFTPSPTSTRGPSSSTPRARPLYTERFSTTLLSD